MKSLVVVPLLVLSITGLSQSRLPYCSQMKSAAEKEGKTFYSNLPESDAQLNFSENIKEHLCIGITRR